ncbi:protein Tube isoform X2 [Ooceraea biroi]|uniref:protein Tube isoform X2 n=1 Tax=Ooceraea biroi TaxID=2015173 RepID=UPI000F089BC5|nr:protein Tube isoform X2 [Ooceraea biroi]
MGPTITKSSKFEDFIDICMSYGPEPRAACRLRAGPRGEENSKRYLLLTMSCACVCVNTEIQDLKPAELHTLGIILNYSDSWKKLMVIVPAERNGFKFNNQHVSIIEQATETDDRNAAEIFIDEWSTMGKKAPTLGLLLDLLIKAELFRAADYVSCDILKQEKPKRPDKGPAAPIDISDSFIEKLLEEHQMLQHSVPTDPVMSESNLIFNQEMCLGDKADNDLIKFSTTNTCEAVNNYVEHTFASTPRSDPAKIKKKISDSVEQQSPNVATHYYEYKEVSSQEIPVFLNNYKQSALSSEILNSSNIPLCLKDLSLE